MKLLKLLSALSLLLSVLQTEAFSQGIISGFVSDSYSGETLINAHVYNKITGKGTLTNPYGFFSFKTNSGDTVHLTVSYVGYKKITKSVFCKNDTTLAILLEPGQALDDVIVKATKIADEDFTPAGRISTAKQLKIPGLLGEKDITKSLQLMPE